MNAMRGGAKTGWTAGLCPEPHGIPNFGYFWNLCDLMAERQPVQVEEGREIRNTKNSTHYHQHQLQGLFSVSVFPPSVFPP